MIVAALLMIVELGAEPASVAERSVASAELSSSDISPAPRLTRPLSAGAILAADDIDSAGVSKAELFAFIGKQTRRYLPSGASLRAPDVREPTLVVRNSVVRIAFERGPLTIAANGRALSDGALGETIRVLNLTSKATIAAVVVERGVVKIP